MSVTIKTVGKERIHIKESMATPIWYHVAMVAIVPLMIINVGYTMVNFDKIPYLEGLIRFIVLSAVLIATALFLISRVLDTIPAYYVDTSMYGVGGKTIVKTNPTDDRIAICKTSHEFELEMLKRMENEDNLKSLVAECK
jgi:hypothetical protein